MNDLKVNTNYWVLVYTLWEHGVKEATLIIDEGFDTPTEFEYKEITDKTYQFNEKGTKPLYWKHDDY